jgi:DNA-binding response OmpR family regulator
VLLVMPDQWLRALLRAALREAGYDAAGTRTPAGALRLAQPEPGRGPVGAIVLDHREVTAADRAALERLRLATEAPIVLIAAAAREVGDGPWARVVRRPVSIGELVGTIATLIPLPPSLRHPID